VRSDEHLSAAPVSTASGEPPLVVLVGARGLLGSAVRRSLARDARDVHPVAVPWSAPDVAVETLLDGVHGAVRTGRPWRLLWCAGAGVVATTQEALDREAALWSDFCVSLIDRIDDAGRARGGVFLASSAGGVHAGSGAGPFHELTPPRPTSPYGRTKLAAEEVATRTLAQAGLPVLVGRISNLYGPGQDLGKGQGLISQLCLNHLLRRPSNIYVSLDTARDYLYVDDAARMLLAATELAVAEGGAHTKVLASERSTTLGAVLGELRRVTGRRPQVVLGTSASARFQPTDLRFVSRQWPELAREARTTLAAGTWATLQSVQQALARGQLAG
jgi:UDP-glucose 4-epimerase